MIERTWHESGMEHPEGDCSICAAERRALNIERWGYNGEDA